ncbi:hypothetical protein [Chryseobacterium sp. EO14]|uniref:hypothetical protein n=1 Tax=Chryseobacterium sp. EO14 TaxID=2950551 RepID=UPI00210B12F8|nr:hypothetical protein [Chryseobacterium sp. EO14]MCQ4139226.1 hypothetical protein [Chryseobacterium sp. EO14]
MTTLSKYQISWIVLTPKTGKATKRDQKDFNSQLTRSSFSIGPFNQNMYAHFASKEVAEEQLSLLRKTNKEYTAVIITDAQFGEMKIDHNTKTVNIGFTQKQLSESKVI